MSFIIELKDRTTFGAHKIHSIVCIVFYRSTRFLFDHKKNNIGYVERKTIQFCDRFAIKLHLFLQN